MSRAQLSAFALAVTTLLVASGCGSSSKAGSTSNSTNTRSASETTAGTGTQTTVTPVKAPAIQLASGKPLTQAQWIAAGDAICAQLNTELAATPVNRVKTFAVVLPQAAAFERAAATGLAKLVPPASKASDWQKILTGTLEWAENTATLGRTAQTGQFTLSNPLVATTTQLRMRILNISKRDGFKRCSSTKA